MATFAIHQDYTGGPFVPTHTFTPLSGFDNGFTSANSRIFFGGAGGLTFDDLSITRQGMGAVEVSSSAFHDDVTVLGGDINVTGAVTSTDSNITLTAAGNLISSAAGTFTTTSGVVTLEAGNTITLTGDINHGIGGTSIAGMGTVDGVVSGAGGLTKLGPGTLVLTAANTYDGITTISRDILEVDGSGTLGSTNAGTVLSGHTTGLSFGAGVNNADVVTILGAFSGVTYSGAVEQSGDITLNSKQPAFGGGSPVTISGDISGVSTAGGIFTFGSGNYILTGTNTWTGPTRIVQGSTVQTASGDAIPDDVTLQIHESSTLELAGFDETIGGLEDFGTLGSSIALGTNTLTVAGNSNSRFTGVISGSGGLVKTGTGTLTLNGTSTFTGTTSVTAGALGGSGTLPGTVSIASGATLAPGNSPGVINTGDLNIDGNLLIDIAGDQAAGDPNGYYQTNVTGTVTLGANSTLNFDFTDLTPAELSVGQTFTIIANDGIGDAVSGTFNGLAEGAIAALNVASSGLDLAISYSCGDGNDVVLSVVTSATTVDVVGGNLFVTSSTFGNINDGLTITANGSTLTITDTTGGLIDLLGPLDSGTGDGTTSVTIPLSSFTGTLDIRTLDGDDTVVVDGLTLLANQSLNITTGDGNDAITFGT